MRLETRASDSTGYPAATEDLGSIGASATYAAWADVLPSAMIEH